jgi:hypothetical protein
VIRHWARGLSRPNVTRGHAFSDSRVRPLRHLFCANSVDTYRAYRYPFRPPYLSLSHATRWLSSLNLSHGHAIRNSECTRLHSLPVVSIKCTNRGAFACRGTCIHARRGTVYALQRANRGAFAYRGDFNSIHRGTVYSL